MKPSIICFAPLRCWFAVAVVSLAANTANSSGAVRFSGIPGSFPDPEDVLAGARAADLYPSRDHDAVAVRSAGLPGAPDTPRWIAVRFAEGGRLTLEWTGGVLQEAAVAVGPWQTVSGARSPLGIEPAHDQRFYRLDPSPNEPTNPAPDRLVWIPPGTFLMGSPESEPGRDADEGPRPEVTLARGFWLGKYEVSQAEYLELMDANPSSFAGDLELPVENVTWSDATNFCARLTARESAAGRLPSGCEYRLPTEAEWEYACRAGTTTATTFGDTLSSTQANFDGSYPYNGGAFGPNLPRTTRIGSYPPNAWGLHDMHGNVWEWCRDWYAAYPVGSVADPEGPATGASRVIRGGRWGDLGQYCRSANRGRSDPDGRNDQLGFRVALVPLP